MSDYHKYVFDKGKFIGDFENMYKNCQDPWIQSKRDKTLEIKVMNQILSENKYNNALDIGCGIGDISSLIKKNCKNLDACDISETAITKAKINQLHLGA